MEPGISTFSVISWAGCQNQAGAAGLAPAAGELPGLEAAACGGVDSAFEAWLRPPPLWVRWSRQLHRPALCSFSFFGSFWAPTQGALDYLSLVSGAGSTLCQDRSNSPALSLSSVLTKLENNENSFFFIFNRVGQFHIFRELLFEQSK